MKAAPEHAAKEIDRLLIRMQGGGGGGGRLQVNEGSQETQELRLPRSLFEVVPTRADGKIPRK